jgi:hypothetical protein
MNKTLMLVTMAVVSAAMLGCAPKTVVATAVIDDKVYPVTPTTLDVKSGPISGTITDLKVTQRVEQGTGRIDAPAKLTGLLKLKNDSADQSVRLLEAKISYIGTDGQPMKLEDNRADLSVRLSSSMSNDRIDPGQDISQPVSVDFPLAALDPNKLKEIHLDLVYLPAQYKKETASVAVSIGGK